MTLFREKFYQKNQYYRLKIEPFVDGQIDHVEESDQAIKESNGNNHLLKFK